MRSQNITRYAFTHAQIKRILSEEIRREKGPLVDPARIVLPYPKGTTGGAWVDVESGK